MENNNNYSKNMEELLEEVQLAKMSQTQNYIYGTIATVSTIGLGILGYTDVIDYGAGWIVLNGLWAFGGINCFYEGYKAKKEENKLENKIKEFSKKQ